MILNSTINFQNFQLSGEDVTTKWKSAKFPSVKQMLIEEVGYPVYHIAVLMKQISIKNACLEGTYISKAENSI